MAILEECIVAESLASLWQSRPETLRGKTFAQIVQFCGDGKLNDETGTCRDLRDFLAEVPLELLHDFAGECLNRGFEGSGFALQDIVNQLRVRLGFSVDAGRYRGVRSESGHDGL